MFENSNPKSTKWNLSKANYERQLGMKFRKKIIKTLISNI